jgi:hypothetical protein
MGTGICSEREGPQDATSGKYLITTMLSVNHCNLREFGEYIPASKIYGSVSFILWEWP